LVFPKIMQTLKALELTLCTNDDLMISFHRETVSITVTKKIIQTMKNYAYLFNLSQS